MVSTDEEIRDNLTHGDFHENIFEILRRIGQHFSFVKIVEKKYLWHRLGLTLAVDKPWLLVNHSLTHSSLMGGKRELEG